MNYFYKAFIGIGVSLSVVEAHNHGNYAHVAGAYDSAILKAILPDQVNQELFNCVQPGVNQTVVELANQNVFFHATKLPQAHVTLAFMLPNPQNVPKNNYGYYNDSKSCFSSLVSSELAPSYSAYIINNGTPGASEVGMFVSGYDQNGQKINRHYWNYQQALADMQKTFTYQDPAGNRKCSVVSCHYVLGVKGNSIPGAEGSLEKDVNNFTKKLNRLHDQGYWSNPYKGLHDDFVGHLTLGVAKVQSGKITQNSQKFSVYHLSSLLKGYKNIQDSFQLNIKHYQDQNKVAEAGAIALKNARIQRKNQRAQDRYQAALARYNGKLQIRVNQKYQEAMNLVSDYNRDPMIIVNAVSHEVQQAIVAPADPVYKSYLRADSVDHKEARIQRRNQRIHKRYLRAVSNYNQDYQSLFNQMYQAKVDSINAHNRNANVIAQKIAKINKDAIERHVRKQVHMPADPVYKSSLTAESIARRNARIQRKNQRINKRYQRVLTRYNRKYQSLFNKKHQEKVKIVEAYNRNPANFSTMLSDKIQKKLKSPVRPIFKPFLTVPQSLHAYAYKPFTIQDYRFETMLKGKVIESYQIPGRKN